MMPFEKKKQHLITMLKSHCCESGDLREQVLQLIPVRDVLQELGISLIPAEVARSARDRILYYFRKYPYTVISRREIEIVAGISQWARRIRELHREFGWDIISGLAIRDMLSEGDIDDEQFVSELGNMGSDDYIMLSEVQDRDAAHRWRLANDIRKSAGGAKKRILKFLLKNIGQPVSGDELRYVAKGASEWARRVRELRTEDGWEICTHWNGRPDLSPGMYVLESDRQLYPHDRKIEDSIRRKVLVRDHHACQKCGWNREKWTPDDPRHLELHHILPHAKGGDNECENLETLCNVCHDEIHAK